MKLRSFLIIVLIVFISCDQKTNKTTGSNKVDIVGNWKLLHIEEVPIVQALDQSRPPIDSSSRKALFGLLMGFYSIGKIGLTDHTLTVQVPEVLSSSINSSGNNNLKDISTISLTFKTKLKNISYEYVLHDDVLIIKNYQVNRTRVQDITGKIHMQDNILKFMDVEVDGKSYILTLSKADE